jgi:hypothetical protein
MKTLVLALCLFIPTAGWAQKQAPVDPQFKMIKSAKQAAHDEPAKASGIQKSHSAPPPGQPPAPAPPAAGDAAGKAQGDSPKP